MSPAGEGTFVRDDGKEIPESVMNETMDAISEFRDACNLAGTPANPVSQGTFIKTQFENWLKTEKPGWTPFLPINYFWPRSGH